MEKKEKKQIITKTENPRARSYPKEVTDKILTAIREGKTMDELLKLFQPRKRCLLRIAKRHNLAIKK